MTRRIIIVRNSFARDAKETTYLPEVKRFPSSAWRRFSQEFELESDAHKALKGFMKEHPGMADSRVRPIKRAKDATVAEAQKRIEVASRAQLQAALKDSRTDPKVRKLIEKELDYRAEHGQTRDGIGIGDLVVLKNGRKGRVNGFVFARGKTGLGPAGIGGKFAFAGAKVESLRVAVAAEGEEPSFGDPVVSIPLGEIRTATRDVTGTKEDVAYGEGYHATSNANPYTDPAQRTAWEAGRAAMKKTAMLRRNTARSEHYGHTAPGMKGGVKFVPPKSRDENLSHGFVGFQHNRDFKSERGIVAKIYDLTGTKLLQQSPRDDPFISENSARRWLSRQVEEFAKAGTRVKTVLESAFV